MSWVSLFLPCNSKLKEGGLLSLQGRHLKVKGVSLAFALLRVVVPITPLVLVSGGEWRSDQICQH